jgi:glycosyltransferase involved in cell wall biosynthesis
MRDQDAESGQAVATRNEGTTDSPMKVGINAFALLSPLTGVGQYTMSLIRALAKHEHIELHLFYGKGWSRQMRQAPLRGMDTWKRIVKRVVPRSYLVSRAAQQLVFSFGAKLRRIDLYHDPNFLAYKFAGPTVITVHDLSWIRFPQTHPPERVAALNYLFPRSLAIADHIITDAEFVRQEVISMFGIAADRITAIPLGVRAEFHQRTEVQCLPVLEKSGLKWRSYLLSVGTLEPRKNLRLALQAYAALPAQIRDRFPLVLVGMRGWLNSEIDSSLAPLIESGAVRIMGYLSDKELGDLYAGARMLIYPSLYEGFGLPPLEAMASGTPVIVSSASTLPEVVGDAGIVVDPHDATALCEAIRLLIEDQAAWLRYQAVGLERASHFSWQRCAEKTLAIYRQMHRQRG